MSFPIRTLLTFAATLPALASAAPAHTILKCSLEGGDVIASYHLTANPGEVRIDEARTIKNFRTGETRIEKNQFLYRLLGRTDLGSDGTSRPVYALISDRQPGELYGWIEQAASKKSHSIDYTYATPKGVSGSTQGTCTEGPAYAKFARQATALPPVLAIRYHEYTDSELALVCQGWLGRHAGHRMTVRAFHHGFGSSGIQVDYGYKAASLSFDHATDGDESVSFSQGEGSVTYPPTPSKAFFSLVKTPDQRDLYEGELFDGESSTRVSCEERWALKKNLFAGLAEEASRAKALPARAGTTAQITVDVHKPDAVTAVWNRYSRLIMDIPAVQGGSATIDRSGGHKDVRWVIEIHVRTGQLEAVRAVIGDSIDGAPVHYEEV